MQPSDLERWDEVIKLFQSINTVQNIKNAIQLAILEYQQIFSQ